MDAPEGFTAVRHAGIVKFVPLPPAPRVAKPRRHRPARPTRVCACGNPMWGKTRCWSCRQASFAGVSRDDWHQHEQALSQLMAVLQRTLGRPWSPWTVCDDCGCLIRPNELCPACVIPWMRANDRVDDTVYYQPQMLQAERRAA